MILILSKYNNKLIYRFACYNLLIKVQLININIPLQSIVIIENQPSSSAHSPTGASHGNACCRPKDFLTNVITISNQVRVSFINAYKKYVYISQNIYEKGLINTSNE